MGTEVVVRRRIAAPAARVWSMVSNVERMGEWSPEATGARWQGGATEPAVGARFTGTNRRGVMRWQTTCTVTRSEPGRAFAFDVSFLRLPIAGWAYDLVDEGDGTCTVGETWTDRRLPGTGLLPGLVIGVLDRADHNRKGMEATLEALAAAAEAAPSAG